jgi:gephyrin
MSRPVAGVRKKTLIVTLPGSPKGAKENLQAILKLLPHACLQAAGGDSRAIHAGGVKKLEHEAGVSSNKKSTHSHHDHNHSHSHGHDHSHHHGGHAVPRAHTRPEDRPITNDPGAGPSGRYRESPYPILPVANAVKLVLENSPSPQTIKMPVNDSLVGYVLAEDVKASEPVPAYRASIVDGYAIIVSESGTSNKGVFPVASVLHAAPGDIPALQAGQIARITTGAPLPPGANAVVMVEDTDLKDTTDDKLEETLVEIRTDEVKLDENIREIGSDIKAGDVVLRTGEEITTVGGELGLLASVGKAEVAVYRKPVIGVLSTGDEIVMHDKEGPLRLGEVRDCNRPTLMAAIRSWGFQVVDYGIAKDKFVYLLR